MGGLLHGEPKPGFNWLTRGAVVPSERVFHVVSSCVTNTRYTTAQLGEILRMPDRMRHRVLLLTEADHGLVAVCAYITLYGVCAMCLRVCARTCVCLFRMGGGCGCECRFGFAWVASMSGTSTGTSYCTCCVARLDWGPMGLRFASLLPGSHHSHGSGGSPAPSFLRLGLLRRHAFTCIQMKLQQAKGEDAWREQEPHALTTSRLEHE